MDRVCKNCRWFEEKSWLQVYGGNGEKEQAGHCLYPIPNLPMIAPRFHENLRITGNESVADKCYTFEPITTK